MSERILMDPPPRWEEEPAFVEQENAWFGRYRYMRQTGEDECEMDVGVDWHVPPQRGLVPREIDGFWCWVEPDAT
jgi:hypothetical protein